MIVKSMPRKSSGFGQLLEYINTPEKIGPAILQNLRTASDDTSAIFHEFMENAKLLPPRKNGNVLYHEVLSFSDFDRERTTFPIMEDLARKYLELRAPCALSYGKAHLDTDCPHVHIMISANNAGSSCRLRISRSRFAGIKRELEAYQREQYPELKHSLVIDDDSTNSTKSQNSYGRKIKPQLPRCRNESERERRLTKAGEGKKKPSQKERVRDAVLRELTAARSGEDFFVRLKVLGLLLYRRGKTVSLEDISSGRRYRLKTLGIQDAFIAALRQWKLVPERLTALQDIERTQAEQLWKDLGIREEIRALFEEGKSSTDEQEQHRQLRRIPANQRKNQRESSSREL